MSDFFQTQFVGPQQRIASKVMASIIRADIRPAITVLRDPGGKDSPPEFCPEKPANWCGTQRKQGRAARRDDGGNKNN